MEPIELEANFVYSMMTIANEFENLKKYNYLIFVEFLDLFCRVAYETHPYSNDPIEARVHSFLDLVFEMYYQQGKWSEETEVLQDINYDIDPEETI